MTKKAGREIANILVPILYGILAIVIAMLVCWSGQYPFGSETMSYLYRGDSLYNAIQSGNIFPLYDTMWYNGVEVLRYCSPLPLYLIAFCQAIAGGDPTDGYMIFVGLLFFMSALVWFFAGKRKNRVMFGTFLGAIWFFMPNNLYELFFIGNLYRACCMIILPLLISYVYDYMLEEKWNYLVKIIIIYVCVALCDLEYAIMIAIGLVICMVIYGIIYHQWRKLVNIFIAVIISIMITGFWSLSYIIGTSEISYVEVMSKYFQSIFTTLNPIERYTSINRYYYFGLAAFIVAVFGIFFSRKKSMPGFWTALLILAGTVSSMYYVIMLIPGKDNLLMCQYISIGLCLILYSFLMWDSLKKPLQIFLCVLLIIDTVPSLNLIYGNMSGVSVAERFDEQNQATLISKAKELCQQRIAYFDGDELEAMGTYLVSKYDNGKATSLGADWNSAVTRTNIMQLNKALNNGFYEYFFDRCMQLGNDTVLVKLSQINILEASVDMLDASAEKVGYKLAASSEFYRLYDMDIEGNWGTTEKYSAIGIGTNAADISLSFPAVKEVTSTNLNDYTFEELSQYDLIYLAGFTYNDRQSAEELVLKLSEAGVKVLILADGIPEDRSTQMRGFLGTTCNDIVFSNGYPLLDTKIGVLDCDLFPQGHENWETVYLNGLEKIYGTVRENDLDLAFCGTVKNDNIVVVGLNISYYHSLTRDESVGKFLSSITDYPEGKIPQRKVVPLTITYNNNSLTIVSEKDNVNTSLAFHQMFSSSQNIDKENNLLYVNAGTTQINMQYPYLYVGLIVTLTGMILAVIFCVVQRKAQIVETENAVPVVENVPLLEMAAVTATAENMQMVEEIKPIEELQAVEEIETIEELQKSEEIEPIEELQSIEKIEPIEELELIEVVNSGIKADETKFENKASINSNVIRKNKAIAYNASITKERTHLKPKVVYKKKSVYRAMLDEENAKNGMLIGVGAALGAVASVAVSALIKKGRKDK